MLRRTYAITLDSKATEDKVAYLIAVLQATPQYIAGMLWSRVTAEVSSNPYHLLWDHGFEDHEALDRYMLHPYHYNIIDEWMYRESPRAIVSTSVAATWDDEHDIDVADSKAVADAIAGPAPSLYAQRPSETPIRAAVNATDDHGRSSLRLIEKIDVREGCTEQYLSAVRDVYMPMISDTGMRLLSIYRTVPGEEEGLLFVWAFDSWEAAGQVRATLHRSEALTHWIAQISPLRIGGKRRMVIPTKQHFGSDDPASTSTPTYLLEEVEIRQGRIEHYLRMIDQSVARGQLHGVDKNLPEPRRHRGGNRNHDVCDAPGWRCSFSSPDWRRRHRHRSKEASCWCLCAGPDR